MLVWNWLFLVPKTTKMIYTHLLHLRDNFPKSLVHIGKTWYYSRIRHIRQFFSQHWKIHLLSFLLCLVWKDSLPHKFDQCLHVNNSGMIACKYLSTRRFVVVEPTSVLRLQSGHPTHVVNVGEVPEDDHKCDYTSVYDFESILWFSI